MAAAVICLMERIDDLQRGGFRIIQDPEKFCFGTDAVLLADFAKARAGEKVCDLCTGTGVIPLLMLARYPGSSYTGVEIQPDMADMASRSMQLNGVEGAIQIMAGDLREIRSLLPTSSFAAVTVNPPYMKVRPDSLKNGSASVSLARHEIACSLSDVMAAARYLLKTHGHFYMVHRPSRLSEIFEEMLKAGIEPKRMQLVYPYKDREATQVLIEGTLGGGQEMHVLPPLVTYEAPGVYTKEMLAVYGRQKEENTGKEEDPGYGIE